MGFTLSKASSILSGAIKSTHYVGLSLTTPGSNGDNFNEPDYNDGYERSQIGTLNTAIDAQVANSKIIFFSESINNGYGTVAYFGLFESEKGGTPYFTGALTTPISIASGYIPIFRKNQLVIGLDKTSLDPYA